VAAFELAVAYLVSGSFKLGDDPTTAGVDRTSLIQDATARGILRTILGLRLGVMGLLVALAFIGTDLRPVTFAAVMLVVLVALVALEISRNLRRDAHRPPKTSA
jgi:hypothetical protein